MFFKVFHLLCALPTLANAHFHRFLQHSSFDSWAPPSGSCPCHKSTSAYYPPVTSTHWKNWRPAGPKDHRGPCPGLNTLANHGLINRNGSMLKPDDVARAAFEAFHMPYSFIRVLAIDAVATIGNLTRGDFSLGNYGTTNRQFGMGLGTHGSEHDCSLTREDAYLGNSRALDVDLFHQMLRVIDEQGKDYLDVEGLAEVIRRRDLDSRARNPLYSASLRDRVFQYGEAAAVLCVMGTDQERLDTVSVEDLISFFVYEKLPENFVPVPVRNDNIPVQHFVKLAAELYYANPLPIANSRMPFPRNLEEVRCALYHHAEDTVHIRDYFERILYLNATMVSCPTYHYIPNPL